MWCINCFLFIFLIAEILSTTTKTPENTVVEEQINLLKAKMVRLRNLKELVRNSTLFGNWEGTCPFKSGTDSQLRCKIEESVSEDYSEDYITFTTSQSYCICWSVEKEKVNWFTAEAFCDYYGMHLISFPLNEDLEADNTMKDFMTSGIWTSANDVITRRVWIFRNGKYLSTEEAYQKQSIQGLDELTLSKLPPLENTTSSTPTTCISARLSNNTNTFYPESCLEKKHFVCQQFIH